MYYSCPGLFCLTETLVCRIAYKRYLSTHGEANIELVWLVWVSKHELSELAVANSVARRLLSFYFQEGTAAHFPLPNQNHYDNTVLVTNRNVTGGGSILSFVLPSQPTSYISDTDAIFSLLTTYVVYTSWTSHPGACLTNNHKIMIIIRIET